MRTILFFLLLGAGSVSAQFDTPKLTPPRDRTFSPEFSLIGPMDAATVWEGVRIKTEMIFGEKDVDRDFKIKSDKDKRHELVTALEGQFQVNIGEKELRSLKRAGDLADHIFEAQSGPVFFSKAHFQGKAERLAGARRDCKENFDCLNYIGSAVVPRGLKVTLYSRPKFKGEKLVIDASGEEVRIGSFFNLEFSKTLQTTDQAVNWREEIHSLRISEVKRKSLSDD